MQFRAIAFWQVCDGRDSTMPTRTWYRGLPYSEMTLAKKTLYAAFCCQHCRFALSDELSYITRTHEQPGKFGASHAVPTAKTSFRENPTIFGMLVLAYPQHFFIIKSADACKQVKVLVQLCAANSKRTDSASFYNSGRKHLSCSIFAKTEANTNCFRRHAKLQNIACIERIMNAMGGTTKSRIKAFQLFRRHLPQCTILPRGWLRVSIGVSFSVLCGSPSRARRSQYSNKDARCMKQPTLIDATSPQPHVHSIKRERTLCLRPLQTLRTTAPTFTSATRVTRMLAQIISLNERRTQIWDPRKLRWLKPCSEGGSRAFKAPLDGLSWQFRIIVWPTEKLDGTL